MTVTKAAQAAFVFGCGFVHITLSAMASPAPADGIDRICPGYFAPVMIRDPETGERSVVPMRYRCRLPSWTEADEVEKAGTYNTRQDKLSTDGVAQGPRTASWWSTAFTRAFLCTTCSSALPLVSGEREQSVEILFTPSTGENLFVACLWTYVEAAGGDPGF